MKDITVFVYGSLLSGFGNHERLSHPSTIFLGNDTIEGKMYGSGIPIIDILDRGTVHGELYQISPQTLESIDRLEGYFPRIRKESGYTRVIVKTHSGIETYVYAMTTNDHHQKNTHFHGMVIESGDYRKYREESAKDWHWSYGSSGYYGR